MPQGIPRLIRHPLHPIRDHLKRTHKSHKRSGDQPALLLVIRCYNTVITLWFHLRSNELAIRKLLVKVYHTACVSTITGISNNGMIPKTYELNGTFVISTRFVQEDSSGKVSSRGSCF